MNNLSSYCGLIDARISASDIDLPVQNEVKKPEILVKRWGPNFTTFAQGKFQIGKVYPQPPQVSYKQGFFQTMKN